MGESINKTDYKRLLYLRQIVSAKLDKLGPAGADEVSSSPEFLELSELMFNDYYEKACAMARSPEQIKEKYKKLIDLTYSSQLTRGHWYDVFDRVEENKRVDA